MNNEGEKIPPDEPDPKLSEVANSLHTARSPSSQKLEICPAKYRLNGGVANPIDEVLAQGAEEEIHEHAKNQHPQHVP